MITKYKIEVNKKYAQAFACLVMFLIGAPLGSIIKKGGLGVPVIISIIFFILYYVMSITGKKWAEEDVVSPFVGIWGYSFILLPVGFFFLRQAKNDARLLESDFYAVWVEKIKQRFTKKTNQQ
jgi:lipopolysaccharide export system permease protein